MYILRVYKEENQINISRLTQAKINFPKIKDICVYTFVCMYLKIHIDTPCSQKKKLNTEKPKEIIGL